MVEVYHFIRVDVPTKTILEEGLKSRRKLIEEGILEPLKGSHFPDHEESIYFRWMNPEFARVLTSRWVSIEVDESARVFNAEYRYDMNRGFYAGSEMTLSELIEKKERGAAMRGTVKGKVVVYNPSTAEPTLVDSADHRVGNRHWFYSNETPVRIDLIPPLEFKNHHEPNLSR